MRKIVKMLQLSLQKLFLPFVSQFQNCKKMKIEEKKRNWKHWKLKQLQKCLFSLSVSGFRMRHIFRIALFGNFGKLFWLLDLQNKTSVKKLQWKIKEYDLISKLWWLIMTVWRNLQLAIQWLLQNPSIPPLLNLQSAFLKASAIKNQLGWSE